MTKRIIIVDDEPEFLYSLDLFLKKEGYATVPARDGAEALGRIIRNNAGHIDLMLLDLDLPRIDGAGVLAELRQRDIDMPVVVVSGTITLERYATLMRMGCRDIFFKPVNPKILLQRINQIISRNSGNTECAEQPAP